MCAEAFLSFCFLTKGQSQPYDNERLARNADHVLKFKWQRVPHSPGLHSWTGCPHGATNCSAAFFYYRISSITASQDVSDPSSSSIAGGAQTVCLARLRRKVLLLIHNSKSSTQQSQVGIGLITQLVPDNCVIHWEVIPRKQISHRNQ